MKPWLGWTIAGAFLGVLAAFVAVGAAGAGHGTYVPAAILFPFTMSLSALSGIITPVLMVLGLAQYPLYGASVGLAKSSTRVWVGLACVHVAAVAVALFLMIRFGNFW
jgi:hypothetical protein